MAVDIFMVVTDQSGTVLAGESTQSILNPYSKATVKNPVALDSVAGMTEQTLNIGSQSSGAGAGKVVFDPFTVTRPVDKLSQAFFLAHASGVAWKFVDLLFVKSKSEGASAPATGARPFLSYRLGVVGIAQIQSTSDQERGIVEAVQLQFGTLQIGYQATAADGTLAAFAPVGWDRTRNVKI